MGFNTNSKLRKLKIMTFIGKNTDFKAIWDCSLQSYTVYYKNRYFTTEYRKRDIETYLN